jgi:probable HAF family extracellular repeat protein
MRTARTFVFSLFLFCLIPALTAAQVYTVTDLGPLTPTAINSWAQVVGNYNNHAYIWTKKNGMQDLGIISGGTFSGATGINDLGAVTGTADGPGTVISPYPFFPNTNCSDLVQPFVWTQRNGMQGSGTVLLPFGYGQFCDVPFDTTGINALGQVVGYNEETGSYQYGFLWTKAGGVSLVEGMGNWPPTFALAISNTGEIVGASSSFALYGVGHAISLKSGIATDLGTLGGGQDVVDYGSSASGVNDLGQIVGWSTTGPVSFELGSPVHAVLWTPSTGLRDLGTLSPDTSSAAAKINVFGQVVGTSGNALYFNLSIGQDRPFEVIGRPFIWSERNGMRDLNTLIRGNSGWLLNSATDINVWGQIVGMGTLNGQPHGFLLTPRNPFKP